MEVDEDSAYDMDGGVLEADDADYDFTDQDANEHDTNLIDASVMNNDEPEGRIRSIRCKVLPALRSKQKLGVAAGTLSKSPPRRTSLADGSADPGEVSQESTLFAGKQRRARNLKPRSSKREGTRAQCSHRGARGMQNRP